MPDMTSTGAGETGRTILWGLSPEFEFVMTAFRRAELVPVCPAVCPATHVVL